jgi:hypothetical protein
LTYANEDFKTYLKTKILNDSKLRKAITFVFGCFLEEYLKLAYFSQADNYRFKKLKELRNQIFHTDPFAETKIADSNQAVEQCLEHALILVAINGLNSKEIQELHETIENIKQN